MTLHLPQLSHAHTHAGLVSIPFCDSPLLKRSSLTVSMVPATNAVPGARFSFSSVGPMPGSSGEDESGGVVATSLAPLPFFTRVGVLQACDSARVDTSVWITVISLAVHSIGHSVMLTFPLNLSSNLQGLQEHTNHLLTVCQCISHPSERDRNWNSGVCSAKVSKRRHKLVWMRFTDARRNPEIRLRCLISIPALVSLGMEKRDLESTCCTHKPEMGVEVGRVRFWCRTEYSGIPLDFVLQACIGPTV